MARAFPWSSRAARHRGCDSPRVKKPTVSEWPPWPLCSPAYPGCAPRNRWWKACSVSAARLRQVGRLLPVRRTNGYGPVCSRARLSSSRRSAQEMQRRDPQGSKTRVALTDGERALQILVERTLGVTLILDLLHVLEKLWKAAYVFHAEGSLPAELWVLDRTLRILFGEVGQVVKGIRQSVTQRRLSGPSARRCGPSRTTYTAIALACVMTSTWPTAGPSPAAPSRAPARTSSRIGWSVRECVGLRRWPRPSSNSELSI